MDTNTAAPLDIDRFLKLLARSRSALHGGGADPERDLARTKAERMVRDAGLTFQAAVDLAEARTDTTELQSQSQRADDWFGAWMREMREEEERASRHPFPEHPLERALREALVDYDLRGLGYVSEAVPDAAMALIRTAIPWPGTLSAAVREITTWDRLDSERGKIAKGYRLGDAAMLRRFMLREHVLQADAVSIGDAVARARWIKDRSQFETLFVGDRDDGIALVVDDLERMADRVRALTRENAELRAGTGSTAGTEKPLRRSNQDKRNAVDAVLREPGSDTLSLRAVADRAGVSPEYVRRVKTVRKSVKR